MIFSEIKALPFLVDWFSSKRYQVDINENLVNAFEALQKYHKENPGETYDGSKNIELISHY